MVMRFGSARDPWWGIGVGMRVPEPSPRGDYKIIAPGACDVTSPSLEGSLANVRRWDPGPRLGQRPRSTLDQYRGPKGDLDGGGVGARYGQHHVVVLDRQVTGRTRVASDR